MRHRGERERERERERESDRVERWGGRPDLFLQYTIGNYSCSVLTHLIRLHNSVE